MQADEETLSNLVEKIASRPEVKERFPDEDDFVVSTMKKQAVRALKQIMQGDGELRRKVLETELDVKTASAEELFKLGRWFAKQVLLELDLRETEMTETREKEENGAVPPAPESLPASGEEAEEPQTEAGEQNRTLRPSQTAHTHEKENPLSLVPPSQFIPPDVSMRITHLEQQLDRALKEIRRLTNENNRLTAENISLKKKLGEAAEGSRDELIKLRAENEDLRRKVEGLQKYALGLEKALEEARGKYRELLDSYAVVKLTRILSLAVKKGRITPSDLAEELHMKRGSIYRGLNTLIRLGFLKRDLRGVYSLAEEINMESEEGREKIGEEIVRRMLSRNSGSGSEGKSKK